MIQEHRRGTGVHIWHSSRMNPLRANRRVITAQTAQSWALEGGFWDIFERTAIRGRQKASPRRDGSAESIGARSLVPKWRFCTGHYHHLPCHCSKAVNTSVCKVHIVTHIVDGIYLSSSNFTLANNFLSFKYHRSTTFVFQLIEICRTLRLRWRLGNPFTWIEPYGLTANWLARTPSALKSPWLISSSRSKNTSARTTTSGLCELESARRRNEWWWRRRCLNGMRWRNSNTVKY